MPDRQWPKPVPLTLAAVFGAAAAYAAMFARRQQASGDLVSLSGIVWNTVGSIRNDFRIEAANLVDPHRVIDQDFAAGVFARPFNIPGTPINGVVSWRHDSLRQNGLEITIDGGASPELRHPLEQYFAQRVTVLGSSVRPGTHRLTLTIDNGLGADRLRQLQNHFANNVALLTREVVEQVGAIKRQFEQLALATVSGSLIGPELREGTFTRPLVLTGNLEGQVEWTAYDGMEARLVVRITGHMARELRTNLEPFQKQFDFPQMPAFDHDTNSLVVVITHDLTTEVTEAFRRLVTATD